jgi:hypothetical protein
MLLRHLQQQLSALYETPVEHCITDFLVTDARLAADLAADSPRSDNRERLLLRQSDGCLDVSLYIDEEILNALADDDPYERLTANNLNDFLIALEGVSHFNYVLWNAVYEKSVTQLELELQAEVDKFVTVTMLLANQGERSALEAFHEALFTHVSFHSELDEQDESRYRAANHYAAKYCDGLSRRFPRRHKEPSFINELRRFYRMSQNGKIKYIDS